MTHSGHRLCVAAEAKGVVAERTTFGSERFGERHTQQLFDALVGGCEQCVGGTPMPSSLAVCGLMTNSNLVVCWSIGALARKSDKGRIAKNLALSLSKARKAGVSDQYSFPFSLSG
jgi:hypothetical protein